MKILLSPIHYTFEERQTGSEYSWAFNIGDGVATKFPKTIILTGFKKLYSNKAYQIVEVQPRYQNIDMSFQNALKFNYLYSRKTFQLLKQEKIDVLHHVLPFRIGKTFNFAFIFKDQKHKYILGPLQPPLKITDSDRSSTDIKSTKQISKSEKLVKGVFRVLYTAFDFGLSILSKRTLDSADKIIVISQFTKELLLKENISESKVEVISPGIDLKQFEFNSFDNKSNDIIELITTGYLVDRKGIDLILNGLKIVVDQFPLVQLRIVGDGPQKKKLEELVRNLNLSQFVIFEGFISNSEIAQYYRKAHLFISMSRSESWGQMYLEAMASGLPIISTENDGSLEIIKTDRFGKLVGQEDYHALADHILFYVKNLNILKEHGYQARKEVEERYDWDTVIIPKYLNIYSKIYNEAPKH